MASDRLRRVAEIFASRACLICDGCGFCGHREIQVEYAYLHAEEQRGQVARRPAQREGQEREEERKFA